MHASHPCPKCNRRLRASGEVTIFDVCIPVYECPECLRVVRFMGEATEVPLVFAVNDAGKAFDPAEPEADLTR